MITTGLALALATASIGQSWKFTTTATMAGTKKSAELEADDLLADMRAKGMKESGLAQARQQLVEQFKKANNGFVAKVTGTIRRDGDRFYATARHSCDYLPGSSGIEGLSDGQYRLRGAKDEGWPAIFPPDESVPGACGKVDLFAYTLQPFSDWVVIKSSEGSKVYEYPPGFSTTRVTYTKHGDKFTVTVEKKIETGKHLEGKYGWIKMQDIVCTVSNGQVVRAEATHGQAGKRIIGTSVTTLERTSPTGKIDEAKLIPRGDPVLDTRLGEKLQISYPWTGRVLTMAELQAEFNRQRHIQNVLSPWPIFFTFVAASSIGLLVYRKAKKQA